jgi:Domain of unknown function (DUF1877)
MSITGFLQQISASTLEKVNEYPSLLDLLQEVEHVDEAVTIDNLYGISSERMSLLLEIMPNPEQILGDWTLRDFTILEDWKIDYLEDFNDLNEDLYQIFTEFKVAQRLDLGKGWSIISYIFTGSSSMEILPFLVDETDNEIRVNAILCGKSLDEDGYFRYLEATQVRDMSGALSRISDDVIRRRLEKISVQPTPYFWPEEGLEELLNFCSDVREFYNSAENQHNAVLISIV